MQPALLLSLESNSNVGEKKEHELRAWTDFDAYPKQETRGLLNTVCVKVIITY